MSEYMHTAVGVMGVVINASGQILLVLSQHRGWEPPQGFLEAGESPILALHREIREETGYSIAVKALTGIYHCVRDGMPIISVCFLCEVVELVSTDIEESLALQWINKEALSTFITHESHLLRVMDALSGQISVSDYYLKPFELVRSMKFPGPL